MQKSKIHNMPLTLFDIASGPREEQEPPTNIGIPALVTNIYNYIMNIHNIFFITNCYLNMKQLRGKT